MNCPNCGINLCFCDSCKRIDDALMDNKDSELLICKGCKLQRPLTWWESLQLDICTEIDWDKMEENKLIEEAAEELPEELAGYCESPWGD